MHDAAVIKLTVGRECWAPTDQQLVVQGLRQAYAKKGDSAEI